MLDNSLPDKNEIILAEPNISSSQIIEKYLRGYDSDKKINIINSGSKISNYLLKSENIQCILLNMTLPYAHEALEIINSKSELRNIPLVIFTSKESDSLIKYYNFQDNTYTARTLPLQRCLDILFKSEIPN